MLGFAANMPPQTDGADTVDPYRLAFKELRKDLSDQGLLKRSSLGFWLDGIPLAVGLTATIYYLQDLPFYLAAVLMGFLVHKCGILGHDASHGYFFKSDKINKLFAVLLMDVWGGVGSYYWHQFHDRLHHMHTFTVGTDLDIQTAGGAFSPVKTWPAAVMKFQHIYYWVLFPFIIPVFIKDSLEMIWQKMGPRDRALAVVRKTTLLIWPAYLVSLFGWGPALLFWAIQLSVSGFFVHMIFMPNHFGLKPFTTEEEKDMSWLERQLRSSRNLSGGAFAFWFYGGLNRQVEHHVFPTVPRHHWRKIEVSLKAVCKKYDLPYYEVTPWQSYVEIYRCLKHDEFIAVG